MEVLPSRSVVAKFPVLWSEPCRFLFLLHWKFLAAAIIQKSKSEICRLPTGVQCSPLSYLYRQSEFFVTTMDSLQARTNVVIRILDNFRTSSCIAVVACSISVATKTGEWHATTYNGTCLNCLGKIVDEATGMSGQGVCPRQYDLHDCILIVSKGNSLKRLVF